MRYFILFLFFCSSLFALNLEIIDSGDEISIRSSRLSLKIAKTPWHMTVMDQNGNILASEGDVRTGGTLPEPPDTPLGYYADEHVFGPLMYRVDRDKRIKALGLEIADGESFHVNNVLHWQQTENGLLLTCSTTEVTNSNILSMNVHITFSQENIFHLKAQLSETKGVWNFSETLQSEANEHYFGLGEHFNAANSRGYVRGMQPEYSPGSKSVHNKVHLLVPFYMSNKGYGLFVPIRRRGYFDVAASFNDLTRFAFDSDYLEFHFIANEDPKETMTTYMEMTGMPPLYPKWVFAPHQWRNVLHHENEVYDDMEKMRSLDIPGSVIWIDNPWQTEYNNFKFNTEQFPQIKQLVQNMRAKGFRVALWSSEFVNVESSDFGEAVASGYVLNMDKNFTPFVMPWANGWGAPINFLNPDARVWWQQKINSCMEKGVSGWKLDYGEIEDGITAVSLGIRFFNGTQRMENVGEYRFNYHKTFNDVIQKKYNGDGFLICRTGTFGDQVNNPAIWPGDLDNDFSFNEKGVVGGLPAGIAGGMSVGMSGFPYYGPDIGGFRKGTPTKNSLIRWAQFGALCPIMQLGGGGNHLPWDDKQFDKETLEIYKKYARLHTDLFPYLYTYVKIASEKGLPIIRPLFLEYPNDENACKARFQYLFGENLLVAPIYQDTTERDVYLPEGTWIDYWSGKTFRGPGTIHVHAPLDTLPLFVKQGSLIPMADPSIDTIAEASDPNVVTWEQKRDHLIVMAYPNSTSEFTLYDGTILSSAMISKTDVQLTAQSDESKRYTWIVNLPHKNAISQVHNSDIVLDQYTNKEAFENAPQGWIQEENKIKVKIAPTKGNVFVNIITK